MTTGPPSSSIVPAGLVIAARSGGAASGTTRSAVKWKRSSARVVPVKVGFEIRKPSPKASTSPGENTTPSPASSRGDRNSPASSASAISGSPTFRTATTRE